MYFEIYNQTIFRFLLILKYTINTNLILLHISKYDTKQWFIFYHI